MITTQALIEKFRQALEDHWGYIWGTAGVLWTKARQDALEKTTDEDRAMGRRYGAKWIGHMVADCSGIFTWAFKQLGGTMYHGSNTMYKTWCVNKGELRKGGRTDGKELKPGTAVFVWNGKNYGHVGLYIGMGQVIESAGTQQGVICGPVTAKKWTHWGELKGVDYGEAGADPQPEKPKDETTVSLPTIRKGNKNIYVKQLQTMLQKLGYNLGICGVDGDYGTQTEKAVKEFQRDKELAQDGVCGPKTWAALQEAVNHMNAQPAEERYTVTITGLTKKEADELCKTWKTATSKKE